MLAQVGDDLVAFAGAEHAVIHKDAVQVLADGLVQQHGDHGGVHTAGERADHMPVAHGFAHFVDHALHKGRHGPVRGDLGDLEQEVAEHGVAVHGVVHFGVELHGVDLAGLVGHGRHFERVGAAGNEEPRRRRLHGITVGHPHAGKLGQINAVPQGAGTNEPQVGGAILAGFGLFQPTTEVEGQKLHTVADAEDRHAEVKESLVQRGSVLFPHARGATRQDDCGGLHGFHLRGGDDAGVDFGIDAGFAHPTGDELRNLRAVVYNDNFTGHRMSFCSRDSVVSESVSVNENPGASGKVAGRALPAERGPTRCPRDSWELPW